MTEPTKFRIYVRRGGKLKVKAKRSASLPKPKNPSAVAFVLRHVSGRTYKEQRSEVDRLLKVVDHTPEDRRVIEQIIQSRCPKLQ